MALQHKQPCVGGILHHVDVNAEQAYISTGVSGLSRRSGKALSNISFVRQTSVSDVSSVLASVRTKSVNPFKYSIT